MNSNQPHEPGYTSLLKAVIDLARRDLESSSMSLRRDAEKFFAPGGGMWQWIRIIREKDNE